MKVTSKHVFFWGGPLGNWNEVKSGISISYHDKVITVPTSEHIFMYIKAMHFGDEETAQQILETPDPKEAKKLGRKVKGFVESEWEKERENAMYLALKSKAICDNFFRSLITNEEYKNLNFVEASPFDKIWGIGLREDTENIDDESTWLGLNLLGKTIDRLRDEILCIQR